MIGGGIIIWRSSTSSQPVLSSQNSNAAERFSPLSIPLSQLNSTGTIATDSGRSLTINGQLKANNGFVITPSGQPTNAVAGQIYYDQGNNQLNYYNGAQFVPLINQAQTVTNLNGVSGALTLGGGLNLAGAQLSNSGVLTVQGQAGNVTLTAGPGVTISGTTISSSGISSLGGATGDISIGNGLSVTNNQLQNSGIISVASNSASLTVTNDGNGNITLTSSGAGTGTVDSPGGTAGRIAKFTGVQTIADSLLSDDGTTVTVGGSLSVTGSVILTTPLSVSSGGTGAANAAGARTNLGAAASGSNNDITSLSGLTTALTVAQGGTGVGTLATNGVLVGNGTSAISSVVAGGVGQCLISTAGAPTWQSCPGGGGVLSVNGLTGTLTVANASAAGSTITINDASTAQKGIAQFNSTNFSVSSGTVNTIQDINTTATPTFAGINTNNITPSGALTVGATNQNLTLQGANTTITATSGANVAALTFVAPTASVTYRLQTAAAGTYDVCTTAGNCVGVGGSVSTSGGSANVIPKYTSANAIGPSLLTDDGTLVTVGGNLTVTGTITLSTPLAVTSGGTGAATASGARTNLGAAASGANSDITSLSGLTTALSIVQGGTGATSLTANGVLLGNGTSAISSLAALSAGQCLVSTAGAPVWQTCPGSGGVTSVNGQTGAVTIANASAAAGTVTIDDASTSQKGIAQFNSTNFSVSSGTVNTIQDIAVSSTPTFGRLTVTSSQASNGMLLVNNTNGSGTGNLIDLQLNGSSRFAVSPAGALTLSSTINGQTISSSASFTGTLGVTGAASLNGGATVTGTLTANTITPSGSLTVGATTQSFTVQGNASSTITATNGANTTTVAFQSPTASVTYRLLTAAAGTYDICTTVGNCAGVGGGVTTAGGTINKVAKFSASNAIADSIITDDGSTVTVGGTLAVNTITPAAAMTIGATTQNLTLQGATTQLTATSGGVTNTLTFATPGTTNKTITIPNASGTVAVSASGPLSLDANGNISCPTCVTSGGGGGGVGAVDSLDGLTGALTIANSSGSGTTVTINDASTSGKGLAQFNSTNFSVSSGVVNTIQNIDTAATPTFGRLTVTSSQASNAMLLVNNTNASGTGNLLDVQLNGSSRLAVTPAGAMTLTGTLNGQTISSSASFTGTLGVTGAASLNGGATVTGTLTANTITPSGSLTVGATSQSFLVQGTAGSTITATNGANTTTLAFQSPTASVTYRFLTAAAGTYDICTTVGNCAGVGGGVTTAGGTTNKVAKFTGSGSIGDSIITDNGSTVTIGGTLAVNTLTPTAALTVGATSQNLTLQGASVNMTSTSGSFTNTLSFATPSGSSKSITIPNASGTLVVSASGLLAIDSSGNITCATCSNTALSNLSSVAINTSLLPGSAGGINVGSGTLPVGDIYLSGTSSTPGTNNFRVTGASTGGLRTITLPDASGTVCLQGSSSCSFAPTTGGTGYIQNGTSVQSANMAIQSASAGSIAALIKGAASQTAAILQVQNSGGTGLFTVGNFNESIFNTNLVVNGQGSSSDIALKVVGNSSQSGTDLLADFRQNGGTSVARFTYDGGLYVGNGGSGIAGSVNIASSSGSFAFINTTTLTTDRTITLPNASGTVCLSAGNCSVTMQATYTASTGGTTPEIKLDSTRTGIDIQDHDSGLSVANNFLSLRASNNAGLGNIVFGWGIQGTYFQKPTSDSLIAFQVQNASANNVFTIDSTNGRVGINLGGSSNPAYTLEVKGDLNVGTGVYRSGGTAGLTSTTCSGGQILQNPVITGGIVTGGTCAANASGTLQNAYDASTNPEFVLDATRGAITIRDASSALGTNLLEVQNNAGTSTYLSVSASQITGSVPLRIVPTSDSTSIFNIKNSANNNVFTVDSTNTRVGIGLGSNNTPTLNGEGLEILGSLRLSGSASYHDLFTTPAGANVTTRINIPLISPSAFGQVIAMGLPSGAIDTARVLSLFDARTIAHQPTLAVFAPDENNLVGFSWEGSNTNAYLKTTGGNLVLRSGSTDLMTLLSGGNVGIGVSPSYKLDVAGSINVSSGNTYKIAGTDICTSSGCTAASGSSNYIQNRTTAQSANIFVQGSNTSVPAATFQQASSGTADVLNVLASDGTTKYLAVASNGAVTTTSTINGQTISSAANFTGTVTVGTSLTTSSILSSSTLSAAATGNLTLTSGGSITAKSTTDSTTAFQIQNASSTSFFTADSTNKIITTTDLNVGSSAGSRLFSDSFEGNSFGLWDLGATNGGGGATATIDSSIKRNGSYSAKFVSGSGNNYYRANIKSTTGNIYMRAYVYVASHATADVNLFDVISGDGTTFAIGRKLSNGHLLLWDGTGAGTNHDTGVTLSTGAWHKIELRANTASAGVVQAYLDGTLVGDYTSSGAVTGFNKILIGDDGGASTTTAYIDDVSVDGTPTSTTDGGGLNVQDSLHVSGSSTLSQTWVRPGTDSTAAFQVLNNSGTGIFSVDTTNSAVKLLTSGGILDLASGTAGNTATLKIPTRSSGTCSGGTSEGLVFRDNGGTQRGHACIDAGTPLLKFYANQFNTSATDVAENYSDIHNNLQPGDLVALDNSGTARAITKATQANASRLFGVVSTAPGILLTGIEESDGSTNLTNPKPVALSGRIPTKVSTENGAIAPGDFLTISSTPGVAMKASSPGMVVGRALEGYTGNGIGTIEVVAQNAYYAGASSADTLQNGHFSDLLVDGTITAYNLTVTGTATIKDLVVTGSAAVQSLHVNGDATVDGNLQVAHTTTTRSLKVLESAEVQQLRVNDSLRLGSASEDPGADTAHPITKRFKATKPIAAGSVVIADNTPGWVSTTAHSGDKRVVGVATTSAGQAGDIVEVAIGGTAKVATQGSITIGDLLHADAAEGKASSVNQPTTGEVVGKVLGNIDASGQALILITLE